MRTLCAFLLTIAAALTLTGGAQPQVIENDSFPVSIGVFIPCAAGGAGEVVFLEGNLHGLISITVNAQNISIKTHFQPQGLSGTGLTTGDKYQGTGVTQDHQTLGIGAQEFTFVNNFKIIGQGPNNNFIVHENVHVTINANGDVTSMQDNFTSDCK